MSDAPDNRGSDRPPASAQKRKRDHSPPRLGVAEVFGDVLPETTKDERGSLDALAERGRDAREDEMLRDVPPHH